MNKNELTKSLSKRADRYTHVTINSFEKLSETLTEKKYSQQNNKLSEYQNFLYKRCLYGTKIYSEEALNKMCWQKRKRINKVYKRTQQVLNLWKQERLITFSNNLFKMFTRGSTINQLLNIDETCESFLCDVSFKDLNIDKKQIIDKLIETNILPNNFNNLTTFE